MKEIPLGVFTLIAGILVTLISLWVAQNNSLLPEQASLQAPLVDNFFNVMVGIGTALFLVVQGAIVYSLIKFRRRRGDNGDGQPIEGNFPLEILWTLVPGIIVIGLGIYSVNVYTEMGGIEVNSHHMIAHDSEPNSSSIGIGSAPANEGKPPSLVVNVSGMQYAWIFNYPDSDINAGELHVPIGQDVQLNISANDVIHSFWVPQFRLKQDAIPGQPTQLRFTATKTGEFPIVCAELCGAYHGSMRSSVVVHTPEDFERWLQENRVAEQPETDQTVAVHS
ncbi:cytochrome c oxidase subunit II [Aetokthonos hydrillicola Thurmond2011]|jgi:cytochrome c oxidase subunit 2|uniref:Cytochrome c oxidase subunit 2 n=1 Tax=Aetokthonos hydrillicola Thurmond2011 TaxID=2712845 RepID=A0AAP5M9A4_9CYAN|nr:cytochrome c oxidase subunit II [Aetokthonos hydrillicola]MBO3457933.1 cytochrome c oxidase subunit II [Aetokthonos hydrillicola CCALA 1050]MBW4587423.1 cytochrome c oxidase subunit II [Aetokthonos hydrillicola CCALA 1050]MDR9899991.1 cytochrome c oxidase subunit II [Aetokthonos hydrillicola Thurmond2011]